MNLDNSEPLKKTTAAALWGIIVGSLMAAYVMAIAVPAKAEGISKAAPKRTAVVAAAPKSAEYSWTGFYIGAHAGVAAASNDIGGVISLESHGAVGGLHAGYLYQIPGSVLVVGVESGYTLRDLNATLGGANFEAKGAWSAVAKAGVTYGRLMLYGLAGYAQMEASSNIALPDKFDGYTVGAGVSAMIADAMSLGMEYRSTFYGAEAITPAVGLEPSEHQLMFRASWHLQSLIK